MSTKSGSFWCQLFIHHDIGPKQMNIRSTRDGCEGRYVFTYIDESLQFFVQIRELVFPLLVICDEAILLLQQGLSLLLQCLPLCVLMVDTGSHESIFVVLGMLRTVGQELLDWDER